MRKHVLLRFLVIIAVVLSFRVAYTEQKSEEVVFPYNKDAIKDLIEKKKLDANAKDKKGDPLIISRYYHGPDFIEYLVSKGADIKAVDKDKNSLLHKAVLFGDLNLVKFLAQKGLDVNAVNKDKKTPLHRAAMGPGGVKVIEFLVEAGANVNAVDKDLNSPLHDAIRLKAFKFLVTKGADINKFNNDGVTPLGRGLVNLDILKYALEESGKNITLENIISTLGTFCKYADRGLGDTKLHLIKYMLERKGKELTTGHIDGFINKAKEGLQLSLDENKKYLKEAEKEQNKDWMQELNKEIRKTKETYGQVIKILEEFKAKKK